MGADEGDLEAKLTLRPLLTLCPRGPWDVAAESCSQMGGVWGALGLDVLVKMGTLKLKRGLGSCLEALQGAWVLWAMAVRQLRQDQQSQTWLFTPGLHGACSCHCSLLGLRSETSDPPPLPPSDLQTFRPSDPVLFAFIVCPDFQHFSLLCGHLPASTPIIASALV